MEKSLQQTVEERRAYINSIRSSFNTQEVNSSSSAGLYSRFDTMAEDTNAEPMPNTLGIRTIIAILIFAVFVYCDKEKITFQDYSIEEVFSQIEWNPLPTEEIEEYVQSL